METRSHLTLILMTALLITACKKEEPEVLYDECGNEICQDCGGVHNPIDPATAYIWVESDLGYVAMTEAVRIYNAR